MKTSFKKMAQKGFTLIELIITIVIIGVLAAVAIPKFQNLTSDAEQGVAAGAAAALASATSVNYGRSKVPGAIICASGKTLGAGTCSYYTLASCADIAAASADLADFPAAYGVTGTATLTANGTSVSGCVVSKGSVSAPFSAYGA